MKCKNCGHSKTEHIRATGLHGRRMWQCPNGSGDTYPVPPDVKIDLHYRAGDDLPWIASWINAFAGAGEAAAADPLAALALAASKIETHLSQKSAEELAIERAIKE